MRSRSRVCPGLARAGVRARPSSLACILAAAAVVVVVVVVVVVAAVAGGLWWTQDNRPLSAPPLPLPLPPSKTAMGGIVDMRGR